MTHPLIPKVIELAEPIALRLNLEVVGVEFHTHKRPPVLRVEVRHQEVDTSLDHCERMSRELEAQLDALAILESAYLLEISSPGIPPQLTTDREFSSFKGFGVILKTLAPYKSRQEWRGKLIARDNEAIHLNQKGKVILIPRQLVASVQLEDGS